MRLGTSQVDAGTINFLRQKTKGTLNNINKQNNSILEKVEIDLSAVDCVGINYIRRERLLSSKEYNLFPLISIQRVTS